MTFNDLVAIIKKNKLKVDLTLLRLAYDFAHEAHKGQIRANKQKAIEHPLHTAQILAEISMDEPTIIAGLLHDVPEDTTKTLKDIKDNFGSEVAMLVEGITKLGKLKYRGIDRYLENLRKMFVAMARDIRTVIIKFADRLDNLETLHALPLKKQIRIAQETLEIYGPIARRLSIGVLRTALEDGAFKYAYRQEYNKLTKQISNKKERLLQILSKVQIQLKRELNKNNIKVIDCHGRAKGLYSLYQKLLKHNNDINYIYDLVALRIVVPTIADCYAALGIIHSKYKPLKERIKDYIAQPKPNHYRSLHTTVFCDEGDIIEIQIRDPKMHEEAEYGIASHWHYKDTELSKISGTEAYLDWIKELAKWHKSQGDRDDYLQSLKIEVFQNRIFVFTPQGDVIDLPEDSTPVDFAYRVHTDIGNQIVGAKVNNNIVSLDEKLKSGDMVEIIIDKNRKGPNYDWIKFVKTRSVRSKIRQYAKPHLWQRLKPW
ncbi:MAG: RelA/SpoT family protein [Candidatus Jacksonbacteria bacterium]